MSESSEHNNFVKQIFDYVKEIISENDICYLKADLFDCERPSLTYGDFIPDVMFCNGKSLIIGEAKTFHDYDTEHSYAQYETYMNECAKFPGESTVIICIPWQLFIKAQNHFKILKNKYSPKTKIIVISENNLEAVL